MKSLSFATVLRDGVVQRALSHGLAGLSLAIGLSAGLIGAAHGEGAPLQSRQSSPTIAASAASLPNGVYLYGQTAEPDQIGQGYFVFEVRQGKVLGALYMPRSSFDCAYGTFQPEQLKLTVVDSYEQAAHPYEIAVQRGGEVAQAGNAAIVGLQLDGFHRIQQVSDNDRRILETCKQNYQRRAWN